MTEPLDLEPIKKRAEACERYYMSPLGEQVITEDVPKLLAEVARLRAVPAPPKSQAQIAERIARQAHAGQTEESTGDDYIHHIERVVAMVEGDEAKAVAWLHDVLEDCEEWSISDLEREGVSECVIGAVAELTRGPLETYAEYIESIRACGNTLAVAVKLADLGDHLRPNCPKRLRPRYERALQCLGPIAAPDGPALAPPTKD